MVLVYGPAHLMRAAWLAGAADYMKDPWMPEELFLRLRGPRAAAVTWSSQRSSLVLEGTELRSDTVSVTLTTAESEVLRILVERRGSVVPRRVLAWAAGCSENRVVDTLVGRIRAKLRRATEAPGRHIASVRGVGYQFP